MLNDIQNMQMNANLVSKSEESVDTKNEHFELFHEEYKEASTNDEIENQIGTIVIVSRY